MTVLTIKDYLKASLCILIASLLVACANLPSPVKSELDLVADASSVQVNSLLTQLSLELYRLNPGQLTKVSSAKLKTRIRQITHDSKNITYAEIRNKKSVDAIRLALNPQYRGDRVFALMIGIASMVNKSYLHKKKFYITDQLNPQVLYDSSVNLDLLQRALIKQSRSQDVLLVTEARGKEYKVYELLSKMAAVQSLLARLTANQTNRAINKTAYGIASAFLPI